MEAITTPVYGHRTAFQSVHNVLVAGRLGALPTAEEGIGQAVEEILWLHVDTRPQYLPYCDFKHNCTVLSIIPTA
jgi:hypothetical protein